MRGAHLRNCLASIAPTRDRFVRRYLWRFCWRPTWGGCAWAARSFPAWFRLAIILCAFTRFSSSASRLLGILALFGFLWLVGFTSWARQRERLVLFCEVWSPPVCLLPPTLLMGGSLPAISRWVRTTPEGVSWVGFLYSANIAVPCSDAFRGILSAARLRYGHRYLCGRVD